MEQYNCIIIKDGKQYTSNLSGIKPLLNFLEEGLIKDSEVIDKIIGKAAALLLVYGKASKVHGKTMSKPAIEIFTKYNIPYSYDILTDNINNRTNKGLCPMELAVQNINEPSQAVQAIKQKVKNMNL